MTDTTTMTPSRGRGKELCDLLRRDLGIPKKATWFEVRFAVREAVSVKCEYIPEDRAGIAAEQIGEVINGS